MTGRALAGPVAERLAATIHGGGGQVIVLGHGFGSDQTVWTPIVQRYMGRFAFLTFNLDYLSVAERGVAPFQTLAAYADDLVALAREARLHKAWYIGHSVSGMIGALASLACPSAFSRLVLLNASPRYLDDVDYRGGFDREDLDRLYAQLRRDYSSWVTGFAPAAVGAAPGRVVDDFAADLRRLRPDIALPVLRSIMESDLRRILPALKAEVTLLHTREDFAVPARVSDYMACAIPGACRMWLETTGHMPHRTAPDMVIAALDDVLSARRSS